MAKSKQETKEEGTTLIKKDDKVTVYGTGKSYLALNKPYEVHSYVSEKLIELGAATADLVAKKADKAEDK